MAKSQQHLSAGSKLVAAHSGQAMIEFAVIVPLMLVLMFALVDFGRALTSMQAMIGLSREGSNLASRGETLPQSAAAVMAGDAPLDLSGSGEVIVTSVTNINQVPTITGQASKGGISRSSKIGHGLGTVAKVPSAAATMLQPGQTIFVTEVFYSYQPVTPIGHVLKVVMPATLYEAAYF
jgi:Flp pilus assembly protein TadG